MFSRRAATLVERHWQSMGIVGSRGLVAPGSVLAFKGDLQGRPARVTSKGDLQGRPQWPPAKAVCLDVDQTRASGADIGPALALALDQGEYRCLDDGQSPGVDDALGVETVATQS